MQTALRQPDESGPGLTKRVVRAGLWTFAIRVSLRSLSAVKTVILARVLAPSDIGLFGVALLMLSLVDAYTYTGFRNALIQRKDDIKPHLDSAWTIEALRGVALAGALILAAPWVARFFGTPKATDMIRVMAASVLLDSLVNVGIVYFERELAFRKRFIYEVSYALAEVVVGTILVLIMRNVWALVYSALIATVVQVAASYLLHPYRPRLSIERKKVGQLFHFGKWVFGNHMLNFANRNFGQILVGRMLGVAPLGFYRMANNMAEMATTEVARVTNQVLFPTFSRLQDQRARLRGAYLRSLSLVTLISLPMAAIAVPLAYHFTEVVLGAKWLPMTQAFQLLMVAGAVRSVSTTIGPLLSGSGRPDIFPKLQLVKLVILGALAYPATRYWGLTGAATAFLISTTLLDGTAFIVANHMVGSSLGDLRRALLYPAACAAGAGLALGAVVWAFHPHPAMAELVVLAGLGVGIYVAALAVCRGLFGYTASGLLSWKTVRGLAS